MFGNIYKDKSVLVTGHAGFKGAWLSFWLTQMGARVVGYSLLPEYEHPLYEVLGLEQRLHDSLIADIRDRETLNAYFHKHRPDMVFHLAAQPLVRLSYAEPVLTYETNVIGTLNVMEATRSTPSVKAFVNVTTDKCYENQEKEAGYHEDEPMGGYDMYSSSKGCSEILTASYRRSFLKDGKPFALASGRAGNVIGGGDWATDRLVPDCIRALMAEKPIYIRNPVSTRPWQHVLEPLSGYLRLGQMLCEQGARFATGYNFGPEVNHCISVGDIAQKIANAWGSGSVQTGKSDELHEATLLQLDNTKAKNDLGISPVLDADEMIGMTTDWYRTFCIDKSDIVEFTSKQISEFETKARAKGIIWSQA